MYNTIHKPKVLVGMSGGVDSSVALVLLKNQGWQPVGASLKYALWQDKDNLFRENVCCSAESFAIAKQVCKKLGAPHYIIDVSKEFKKEVIDYFVRELKAGRTPNPCIICNSRIKFKKLFEWAKKRGIKYVATGHYAQIKRNKTTGECGLIKARDKQKDQTYSLCFLPQKWLKHIVFPLGDYTKTQVFQIAEKQGFGFYLKRPQSQDLCFVSGKCLNCFLEKEIGRKAGLIKDTKGNVLGQHSGLHFYTIGQRKGLYLPNGPARNASPARHADARLQRLQFGQASHAGWHSDAGGPYFVACKDVKNNVLVVSKDIKNLYSRGAILSPCNLISERQRGNKVLAEGGVLLSERREETRFCEQGERVLICGEKLKDKIEVMAKVRYSAPLARAVLKPLPANKIELVFKKPQQAITPGQFAVFYRGNVCLGGGRIIKTDVN